MRAIMVYVDEIFVMRSTKRNDARREASAGGSQLLFPNKDSCRSIEVRSTPVREGSDRKLLSYQYTAIPFSAGGNTLSKKAGGFYTNAKIGTGNLPGLSCRRQL